VPKPGRPPEPLIRRHDIVAAALRLVDDGGIDSVTLRKLAAVLNVHPTSLYHHFENRQAILDAVARSIMLELRPPARVPDDFISWSVANAMRARRALLAHPDAIPLFVSRYPRAARREMYESEFAALATQGIAERYRLVFVESLEALVVGAVLYLRPAPPADEEDPRSAPLTAADYDLAFEVAYRGYVVSLLDQYRELSRPD
jgi:TetR/AcrR family transcriptional regulator, tetracycline repressor protein